MMTIFFFFFFFFFLFSFSLFSQEGSGACQHPNEVFSAQMQHRPTIGRAIKRPLNLRDDEHGYTYIIHIVSQMVFQLFLVFCSMNTRKSGRYSQNVLMNTNYITDTSRYDFRTVKLLTFSVGLGS